MLAVDEKPAIQALERAQGYLKLPHGRSLHGALRAAIDAFIEAYNATAAPFHWRKATIQPKGIAPRITDLR